MKRSFRNTLGFKVLEKDIQSDIIRYLKIQGVFCWRQNSVGVYDTKKGCFRKPNFYGNLAGISDILGVFKGKALAIEVKRPGNKPSDAQLEFISRFMAAGGIAFVAYGISDVERILFPKTSDTLKSKEIT